MHRLLEALERREEYERTHEFYLCEVDSIRFEFGEAMEFGFECPQCGTSLESLDNDRLVDAMERRIDELRTELNIDPQQYEPTLEAE
jgi:transcription initiation factor TFIIE subunit alpha